MTQTNTHAQLLCLDKLTINIQKYLTQMKYLNMLLKYAFPYTNREERGKMCQLVGFFNFLLVYTYVHIFKSILEIQKKRQIFQYLDHVKDDQEGF